MLLQKTVFFILLAACLTPFVSPPVALAVGLIFALVLSNPFPALTRRVTTILLQVSVVLLGFGIDLTTVIKAGKDGAVFAVATIFGTLLLGYLIGKFLNVQERISSLISSGTAICGGSAIAAVAPVIKADSEEISVSLGTIFILNSAALFIFPAIGHYLGLSPTQFGIWAAIAIQDTSSVVGAAARYGDEALQIATIVKLARALWIVPVALLFAYLYRAKNNEQPSTIAVPWFIFLFLLATVIRSYAPEGINSGIFDSFVAAGKTGLTLTLFLIGASLSRETLKKVGVKPLVQGVLLWLFISVLSLWAVWNIL